MGGIAYIDKRRLETEALAKWLRENMPLYLNFGDKPVAFAWDSFALAEALRRHLCELYEIGEAMPVLTDEQMKFLRALASWQGVATPQDLRLPADRKQDRARQRSRRMRLVTFDGGYWRLTDAGREALRD